MLLDCYSKGAIVIKVAVCICSLLDARKISVRSQYFLCCASSSASLFRRSHLHINCVCLLLLDNFVNKSALAGADVLVDQGVFMYVSVLGDQSVFM